MEIWKYLLWISLTLAYNFLVCLVAVRFNLKSFWYNYLFICLVGLLPTWSLASYYSRNLIFDGLLYDTILVISSVIFLAVLGQAQHLNATNWIGVVLVIAGLILTRLH